VHARTKLRLRKIGLPRETTPVVCCVVSKQSSPLLNPSYLQRNRSIVLDVKKKHKKNSSTIQQQWLTKGWCCLVFNIRPNERYFLGHMSKNDNASPMLGGHTGKWYFLMAPVPIGHWFRQHWLKCFTRNNNQEIHELLLTLISPTILHLGLRCKHTLIFMTKSYIYVNGGLTVL
jgi:hypothetical protein